MQNCSVLKPTHKVTNSDKMHFRKDVIERERSKKGGGKKKNFLKRCLRQFTCYKDPSILCYCLLVCLLLACNCLTAHLFSIYVRALAV